MDCLTFSTARESLQCSVPEAQGLSALLQDGGSRIGEDQDDLDHGFTLEHDARSGRLFVFAEDGYCNPEALPEVFCRALGELAQRAGVEAIEFGVAQMSTRFSVNSHGGYQFRIQQDGRLVYPTLAWPMTTIRPMPTPSLSAAANESSDPLPPAVNAFETALAAADPILAALDAVLKHIHGLQASLDLPRDACEEALDLVAERLTSVLEKAQSLGHDLSADDGPSKG